MQTLRREQMDALDRAVETEYIRRLVPHLRQEFPKPCSHQSDEQLADIARWGLETAYKYGYSRGEHTSLFIYWTLLLGRDFDQGRYGDVSGILRDRDFSQEQNLDRASQSLSRRFERVPH
jgi:hypothetical protein